LIRRIVAESMEELDDDRLAMVSVTGADVDRDLHRAVVWFTSLGDTEEDGVSVTIMVPEEKGSDVNLASHLLIDIYVERIDAAVVVSNDSDLRLPVQHARTRVPVGTVNPRGRDTAADLRGNPGDGVGGHWWHRLGSDDFFVSQLPDVVAGVRKPDGW